MPTSTDAEASAAAVEPVPAAQPWKLTFDSGDNYCSVGVDEAVAELPEHIAQPLRALSDDDAADRLKIAAEQAERDDQDDLADALRYALDRLLPCEHSCTCSQDAWDSDRDYFNEALTSLGDHRWAVRHDSHHHDDTLDDVNDHLTYERVWDVFGAVNSSRHYGWDSLELEWDGQKLTVEFAGYRLGWDTVVFTPLTDAQAALAARWDNADSYDTTVNSGVLNADTGKLEDALDLFEALEQNGSATPDFGDLLEVVVELGPDQHVRDVTRNLWNDLSWRATSFDVRDVLRAVHALGAEFVKDLYCPSGTALLTEYLSTWDGPFDDLLSTAHAVLHGAAAPAARTATAARQPAGAGALLRFVA